MIRFTFAVCVLLFTLGCGQVEPDTGDYSPLSLEAWKEMPLSSKYEVGTLERLKAGNPELYEPREWKKFLRNVLLPMKKSELANS